MSEYSRYMAKPQAQAVAELISELDASRDRGDQAEETIRKLQAEIERLRSLLRPALAHHGIMRKSDLKDVELYFDELKHKGADA